MRTYALAIRSHLGATIIVNTLCVRHDPVLPGSPDVDIETAAADVKAWLEATYKAILPVFYTIDAFALRDLYTDTPAEAEASSGLVGTLPVSGTSKCPVGASLLLSIKSGVATRSGRGRLFLPSPIYDGYMASSVGWLTSGTYWTNVTAFKTALLDGHDVTHGGLDSHLSLRIHSRKRNEDYDATSITLREPYHYLRSRTTSP